MKRKIGVIFGGKSVEHEVSISSAIHAMNNLDETKYDIIPIYITKENEWYTGHMLKDIEVYSDMSLLKKYAKNVILYKKNNLFVLQSKNWFKKVITDIDIVLPITHGTNVEDGVLQGYLQTINIPYVGSDVYSAVVAQDKVHMKRIFESEQLPITNYEWFYDTDYKNNEEEVLEKVNKLKFPVIVKPSSTGSSIGIEVCSTKEELSEAIEDAIKYDTKIIVEEVVTNLKEVNIAVMGNYTNQKVSVTEEMYSDSKFLTFNEKYIGSGASKGKTPMKASIKGSKSTGTSDRLIPANISSKLLKEIEEIATKGFKAVGSSGNVRIDFLIDSKTNKVYINEINSIPGNMAFHLWNKTGIEYSDLLEELINISIKSYKERNKKVHSFKNNLLENFISLGGVKGMKGSKKL